MNEQQLLEAQLARERAHLMDIAAALDRGANAGIGAGIGAPRETRPVATDHRLISNGFIVACEYYLMFIERLERARACTLLERSPGVATATHAAAATRGAAVTHAVARLQAALARCSEPPTPSRGPAGALTDERSDAAEPHVAAAHAARRAELAMQLLEARAALEGCLAASYSLEDRRAVAHLDADSILEERRLYREVLKDGLEPRGA